MTNQLISKEPRYNLSYVIQETKIKADTLRAWERRYQLPQPHRTEGGHRLFSEYDIETLKWLIARQREGMSISRAVRLWREIESQGRDPLSPPSTEQMPQPYGKISEQGNGSLADIRKRWIQACLDFDEFTAEQFLNLAFAQFPMETVCVEIMQSGLSTIGTLWHQGEISVQQEHFASELATRRLHALIAAAPKPVRGKTILVGCPPGENHTFSALLTTLLLRCRSWRVVYLGANVPKSRLLETIEVTRPDLVVMVAMRLATSATLLDIALLLGENNVPIAFGGWIFTQTPDLPQKIPGHYLGGDVIEAISKIERFLMGSIPSLEIIAESGAYAETIIHFIEKKHQIETQTLEGILRKIGRDIPLEYIKEANEFLAQDLIAALSLGDLSLVSANLEWIESLIANHDIAGEMLFNYLLAYYRAAQAHLDVPGDPIIEWLGSIIQIKT